MSAAVRGLPCFPASPAFPPWKARGIAACTKPLESQQRRPLRLASWRRRPAFSFLTPHSISGHAESSRRQTLPPCASMGIVEENASSRRRSPTGSLSDKGGPVQVALDVPQWVDVLNSCVSNRFSQQIIFSSGDVLYGGMQVSCSSDAISATLGISSQP